MEIEVKDKVIAITGGYGYLGSAISLGLTRHGAQVIVLGRSEEKFIEKFSNREKNQKITFLECDISSERSLAQAFKKIQEQTGKLDCLINNAFYLRGQSPDSMSGDDFTFGLEGCLTSIFLSIKQAMPYLKKGASIINLGSMYGIVAPDFRIYDEFPNFLNPPHYGAAKAGVVQLTKYYASYLGAKGIRVNAVSPGPFPSISVQENREFIESLNERTLLGRIGQPEELAGIFVYLASQASSYVTGQNFVIDGGWTTR